MSDWSDPTATPVPTDIPSPQTGDARVDGVLASLHPLDSAPVSAHVAVFETAIAHLRSVLDDAGAEQPG